MQYWACRYKKYIMILFSIVFLTIYLGWSGSKVTEKSIVGMQLITNDELREKLAGKTKENSRPVLMYEEMSCAYDTEKNTFFIPQNLDTNVYEGKLYTEKGKWKLFLLEDDMQKNKQQAIESGLAFTLYLIGKESYYECQVTFTGAPILMIQTVEEENRQVDHNGRIIYHGEVSLVDPYRSATTVVKEACSYHIRGGSSESYEKSNYKLELNEKKSLLGMQKDDDWVLNSLYDDAGLVHNKVSLELWKRLAKNNFVANDEGIEGEYVEVFLDQEYRGVYLLMESPDKKSLSLDNQDKLYKCRADRIPEEHNYTNEYTDDMRPIFLLKYPNEDIPQNWIPLKNWVNVFLKGEGDTEQAENLLNMENAIDYNLFCLIIGGMDNLRKNVFFVAELQEDGDYKFKKIPWDMNATFGNPWVDYEEYNYTLYDPEYYQNVRDWPTDTEILYYLEPERISEELYERWCEVREEGVVTEDVLDSMFDKEYTYLYLSGMYKRNYECWPDGMSAWRDEYVYEYVSKRVPFLDWYFEDLYKSNTTRKIFNGVDYTEEFDPKYYWDRNYDVLSELFSYDSTVLLEHYALYGKEFGLQGRKEAGEWNIGMN